MKLLIAGTFVVGVLFLCSASWAQLGPQPESQSETEDMDAEAPPSSAFPYGSLQRTPQRRGAARLGEWICRDEPPPPGHVITKGGSMGSCVGTCASRYIERLRDHMVICAGQKVPEGYDLLGITTVADCDCVADTENALIIQLKPGYKIKRQRVVRDWNSPESADSTENSTDLTGE